MATLYKGEGETITVTLASGETSFAAGKGYKIGSMVGVIVSLTRSGQTVMGDVASAAGDIAVVALEGVFTITKASSGAIAIGAKVYWDNTNKNVTSTSSGNTAIGFAYAAAADGDTVIDVLLSRF